MAAPPPPGPLMDLEKELSCSICTDVLYQPLTLLDCLHTFCGACLKEWFSWQAQSATTPHPYTCPSCRASVRATQPNATVTTLLDMFLAANPGRGKSDAEKEDMRKIYKPGDNVLPKLRRRRRDTESDEDRRMLEEVRQLSLQEVGVSSGSDRENLSPPGEQRRRRDRSREPRDAAAGADDRHRRPRDRSAASRTAHHERVASRSTSPRPQRVIEHQSSLRSLISASDFDSQEMEEEIMRQIREEGLLDGIDLDNIDVSQEEEITERIAAAFRRRQRERERARARARHERSRSASTNSARQPQDGERPQRRPQRSRAESATQEAVQQAPQSQSQPQSHSRPPVSRPHLFEAVNDGARSSSQRRSSSQDRNVASRRHNPRGLSIDSTRPAARSATDLTNRPQTTQEASTVERQRPPHHDRRVTDPEGRPRASEAWLHRQPATSSAENSPRRAAFTSEITTSPPLNTPAAVTEAHAHLRQFGGPGVPRHGIAGHIMPAPARRHNSSDSVSHNGRPSSSSGASGSRPASYPEPSISCNRCGKQNIEYNLHYNCRKCHDGKYNLCLRCYRSGAGCLNWYGFGQAAWMRYERRAPPGGYPPGHDRPHFLTGHRYTRPRKEPVASGPGEARTSEEEPSQRLQAGVFCDICLAFANGCYWKCDVCNEGAWGFCNDCVNQGRHCTHPLLPLQHRPSASSNPRDSGTNLSSLSNPPSPNLSTLSITAQPPMTPKSASLIRGPGTHTIANLLFRPLTFSTLCDICTYPIPPSHTRYHCQTCNAGNSDVCTSCYHTLVTSGRIAPENGQNGWRRCPRGHRMVVVGFEDRDAGQRRVVTKDLVGGYALKDDGQSRNKNSSSGGGGGPKVVDTAGPSPPGQRTAAAVVQQQPDPAAAGAKSPDSAGASGGAAPAWRWRDTDGTIRKARTRAAGLARSNSASSTTTGTTAAATAAAAGAKSGAGAAAADGNTSGAPATSGDAAAAQAGGVAATIGAVVTVNPLAVLKKKKFPPDGGIGLRATALWSYWPAEGVTDELTFPKGAEIREAEDINGDWFWGCYAGAKGLFPGNYVRKL